MSKRCPQRGSSFVICYMVVPVIKCRRPVRIHITYSKFCRPKRICVYYAFNLCKIECFSVFCTIRSEITAKRQTSFNRSAKSTQVCYFLFGNFRDFRSSIRIRIAGQNLGRRIPTCHAAFCTIPSIFIRVIQIPTTEGKLITIVSVRA